MTEAFLQKQDAIRSLFKECADKESRYNAIIEIGKEAAPLDPLFRTSQNLVHGCQSTVYLRSFMIGERIYFESESDALISAGLAQLLVLVYSGELPETVVKSRPLYLEELGIPGSLTPNRAQGLYSIHLRMKQDALKLLINRGCQSQKGEDFNNQAADK